VGCGSLLHSATFATTPLPNPTTATIPMAPSITGPVAGPATHSKKRKELPQSLSDAASPEVDAKALKKPRRRLRKQRKPLRRRQRGLRPRLPPPQCFPGRILVLIIFPPFSPLFQGPQSIKCSSRAFSGQRPGLLKRGGRVWLHMSSLETWSTSVTPRSRLPSLLHASCAKCCCTASGGCAAAAATSMERTSML
jgi:hypothetical protein